MRFYWLIIGTVAVWRVTYLFVAEDGPWRLLARFRQRAGKGLLAEPFHCFYCLSLWLAVPVALLIGEDWQECALLWFAFSGGAILLERATVKTDVAPSAVYHEDPEDNHGMLRKE